MRPILVAMADNPWTTQALHLACALGRDTHTPVTLLHLNRVEHIRYLGSEFGDTPLSGAEQAQVETYAAVAQEYGVDLSYARMSCYAPFDAVIDAVCYLDARAIFVKVPTSSWGIIKRFQVWWLERRLSAHHCQLYRLDQKAQINEHAPSITIRPVGI